LETKKQYSFYMPKPSSRSSRPQSYLPVSGTAEPDKTMDEARWRIIDKALEKFTAVNTETGRRKFKKQIAAPVFTRPKS